MPHRALLIANWEYDDPDKGYGPLNGPRNDLKVMKRALEHPDFGLFKTIETRTNLPWAEMRSEFSKFLTAGRDDNLLIYFSGHGDRLEDGGLALCGVNTASGSLRDTSVDTKEVRNWIEGPSNRAVSTLVILDCCYSGAFKGAITDMDLEDALGSGTMVLSSGGGEPSRDGTEEEDASPFTAALAAVLLDPELCGDSHGIVSVDEVYDRLVKHEPPLKPPPKRNIAFQGTVALARRPPPVKPSRPDPVGFHAWADDEVEHLRLRFSATKVMLGRASDPVEPLELEAFSDYRRSAVTRMAQLADAVVRGAEPDDEWAQRAVRNAWNCIGIHLFETGLPARARERLRSFVEPAGAYQLLKLRLTFEDSAVLESCPWEYLYRDPEPDDDRVGPEQWPVALSPGLLLERVVHARGPASLATTIEAPASVGILNAQSGDRAEAISRIADGLTRMSDLDVVFDQRKAQARWPEFTQVIQHRPKILIVSAPVRRTPQGVDVGFWPADPKAEPDWHSSDDLVSLVRSADLRFGAIVLVTFTGRPAQDAVRCTSDLAGRLAKAGLGPVAFVCHSPLYAPYVPELGENTFPVLLVDVLTQGKRFDDAMYFAKQSAVVRSVSASRWPFGVPGYYVTEPEEPEVAAPAPSGFTPRGSQAPTERPPSKERA